jgi:filamentous hemagglutinin
MYGNNSLLHGRTYEPEVGLYYFRNRYYHPKLGRFLQQDPNGYEDSLNAYQAFNQNPVNFTDPMGQEVDLIYFDSVVYDGNITKSMRRNLALTTEGTINTGLSFSQWFAHMLKSVVTIGYADQPWTYTTINFTNEGDFFQINQDTRSAGGKIVGIVTDPIKGVSDWAANNILSFDPNINPKYQEQFHENAVRQTPGAIIVVYTTGKGARFAASKINSAIKSSPYFENTWVLMDDAFANLKVEATGKTPQILLNKAEGVAFENWFGEKIINTRTNVRNQITVKTQSGVKTKLDFICNKGPNNIIQIFEAKASPTAPLTTNQKIAFPIIELEGATIVGEGKPPFTGGCEIPPTKVIIIRNMKKKK